MVTERTWSVLVGSADPPECPTCRVVLRRETTSRVQRADGRLGLEHEHCGDVFWTHLDISQVPPRTTAPRSTPHNGVR